MMTFPDHRHLPLAVVGCALLLATGCGAGKKGTEELGSPARQQTSSAPGQTNEGQDTCALLTDEQLATYLGDDIPEPQRSAPHDRPTCTWDDESLGKFEVSLWHPPVRSIITDDAERSVAIDEYTGYIESESERSCTINVQGPNIFLALDVFSTTEKSEDDTFCDSITDVTRDVIHELDW